jgi:hypothetical protein
MPPTIKLCFRSVRASDPKFIDWYITCTANGAGQELTTNLWI